MWQLVLLACVHRPPAAAPARAALVAWEAPTPLTWRRVAAIQGPDLLGFRVAAGTLWAWGSLGGSGDRFLRLTPEGGVAWERSVMDGDFWQVSADGSTVLVTDLLGCNVALDAATGARRFGNPWVVEPYDFALDPTGAAVWSFDMDGKVVGWPLVPGAPRDPSGLGPAALGRFPVGEEEGVEGLALPRADRLLLVGEDELVLRRLPDGALLGRAPLPEGAELCAAGPEGVGVRVAEGAPPGWTAQSLAPLSAAPPGCRPALADRDMDGWRLRHPRGPVLLGDEPFDVHLAADGSLWVVAEGRVERWVEVARPVRRAPLREGQYPTVEGDPAYTVEVEGGRLVTRRVGDGGVVDEVWLTPPAGAGGGLSVYQAALQAGTLRLHLRLGEEEALVEIGPPAP